MRSRALAAGVEDPEAADAMGRASVLDTSDDVGLEGIDVTPGADTDPDTSDTSTTESQRVRARLRELAKRADSLAGPAEDAKLALLTRQVKELLVDGFQPIVFCKFIHTADYVAKHLSQTLGANYAVGSVTGILPPAERVARVDELTADPDKRPVLVATDCLSEGVNLQEHFQAVIHYDLAWNPTRHEQREGRVDRFGQAAAHVKALTIYGRDNQVDGIILDILIKRHRAISAATGVSVPVPDQNDSVLEALTEGLLLRGKHGEQLTLDFALGLAAERLHTEWESAAAKERNVRTKYQHEGLRPDLVAREVIQMREAVGTTVDIEPFLAESLSALGGQEVSSEEALAFRTGTLVPGLRDALPLRRKEPLTFVRNPPAARGNQLLARTDPSVAAVARHILEAALDSALPQGERPARRAGVIRTHAVSRRTTLLLVRYRFHLDLPSRAKGITSVVAEDCELLAFTGSPARASWLGAAEAASLLDAEPVANIPSDQATAQVAGVLTDLSALEGHLAQAADARAAALADSHARVRQGSGEIIRSLKVRAEHPVDILGVYVYLPVAQGAVA